MSRSFFELCDGIFLNYNWTDQGLEASRVLAGDRYLDVYVGIDVFGRGCPGGGGYNSCAVCWSYNITTELAMIVVLG